MGSISTDVYQKEFSHAASKNLNIIIVGASLGGLAAALAIKRLPSPHAHTITLLERNPTALLHNQGAGIGAGGDTIEFFKKYDRCGRDVAAPSFGRQYLVRYGEIIHKEDMRQSMTSWDLLYHLLRANVDGVESDYCDVPEGDRKNDRVKHLHGHKVTGIEEKSDKILVRYETSDAEKGAMEADLVIGADGPSSTVRSLLMPSVERTYAGYVALRGTVLEEEASPEAQKAFSERFVFHHQTGIQILAYLIPGANGTLEPGKRLINFVYYTNVASPSLIEPSSKFRELMTDVDGRYHRITMPPGKFDPTAWEKQCVIAKEKLPPQFAELVCRTKKPFIQAVTDAIAPTNELMNGRVILLGDALAGFRPHTTASTSQACFDAMMLADLIDGKVSKKEWKKQVMGFARTIQQRGLEMGRRSQFEDLPLEEHIKDRNLASRPRDQEVWPEWAVGDVE